MGPERIWREPLRVPANRGEASAQFRDLETGDEGLGDGVARCVPGLRLFHTIAWIHPLCWFSP